MQHERHRVPVTAVAFWRGDVLLAGEGSILNAYNVHSKKLLASVNIFDGQAIHGIINSSTSDGRVLLWGGHHMRALTISQDDSNSLRFKLGIIAEANDWILDAAFSESKSHGICRAAIVTAHSALGIATVDDKHDVRLERVVPGSNCILYTAHVTWLSPFKCLIASGTAFGDIIVWSAELSVHNGKHTATWQTHYTFSAHDGSVFGVQIASGEVATALGLEKHVLASCSDDRTIRVWDISDLSSHSPTITETQRETGFGSKPMDEAHAPLCIAKAMGHISRIWHVRFLYGAQDAKSDESAVRLTSFGEDATCITWSFKPQNDSPVQPKYTLQHGYTERPHNGKNIWSVAHASSSIAVGAADGAISIRCVSEINTGEQRKSLTIPSREFETKSDMIRSYTFASAQGLLAISDRGKITRLSVDSDDASQLVKLPPSCSDAVRGYSICTGSHRAAFFAGMKGLVYMYDSVNDRCCQIAKTERKVVGLYSQPIALDVEEGHTLLVTDIGSQAALCLQLSCEHGKEIKAHSSMKLSLPDKSFVVTSFAQHDVPRCSFAILGSRSGSIAIYDLNVRPDRDSLDALCCVSIHEKEAVTSLKVFATAHGDDIHILSTGRDGTFAVHTFTPYATSVLHLTCIHQLLLPFGPNIEGQCCINDNCIWVWGFKSKSFVVYDITSQREIMNVECGGVHRNWAFEPATNGGTFVWTQASNLYYQRRSSLPFEVLSSGGHGREIKTMATAPTKAGLMIATGAEDTNIKLWLRTEDGNGTWRCLHTLLKHNTGIQHLWWSRSGEYLFSSGGFEEFFVWRIRYNVPKLGVGVVCESTHPNSGSSDLRIMSFDVAIGSEGEGRRRFRITMVYSDSSIRTWQYHDHDEWKLLASGDYLTSCLTQCLYTNASPQILTASTDGHLATFSIRHLSRTSRHKVHKNAILSMIHHSLSTNHGLIITGGDDNALAFTSMTDFTSLVVPQAHAAAITALAIVRNELLNSFWLVTGSIDQHVKLWEIDLGEEDGIDGIKIKLLQNSFTAVADVSCMEAVTLEDGQIAVVLCGVGMDVWRIDKDLS
ncbi:Regulator of Ty1 transposition protein 10 [Pseudocercospora fuligena]|uniref:Regulator of Ty1 transposition protein 10 n=1 Tax=Pseudocercospora fuligena TaxID=685502 RepID=A0A8H6RAI4_9PEZI|nr:Regulator of Ty1 transposition protein 10 [Pseudocercospora fuligena]